MATKLVCFLFAVTLLVTPSLARPAPQSEAEPIGPCTSCPSVPVGQFVTCPNVSRGSIDVTSISLSPIPLRRGQNATLSVSGNLTQSVIQVANASIDITRGVFTSTNTVNLCDALSGAGINCPLPPGAGSASIVWPVPLVLPPGEYNVRIRGTNGNNSPLTCVRAVIPVQ